LLVEDNPGDVDLTREALAGATVGSSLHVVADGEEAMTFLRQEGIHRSKPRPDLILLDLNLPRKDGREVLEELKDDPHLRSIPVVILSSSQNSKYVLESYASHASCYVSKPVKLGEYMQTIRAIVEYWSLCVTLPTRKSHDYLVEADDSGIQLSAAEAFLNQHSS
jgi:CheY-like chemotaxis protein